MRRDTFHPDDFAAAQAFTLAMHHALDTERPGLSVPVLAKKLHVSPERLRKWLNVGTFPNNMPYYLAPLWDKEVGPGLLRQTCHTAGYRPPTPLPVPQTSQQAMLLLAHTVAQFGVVLQAVAPYLEARCPQLTQQVLQDATLALMTQLGGINEWTHSLTHLAA